MLDWLNEMSINKMLNRIEEQERQNYSEDRKNLASGLLNTIEATLKEDRFKGRFSIRETKGYYRLKDLPNHSGLGEWEIESREAKYKNDRGYEYPLAMRYIISDFASLGGNPFFRYFSGFSVIGHFEHYSDGTKKSLEKNDNNNVPKTFEPNILFYEARETIDKNIVEFIRKDDYKTWWISFTNYDKHDGEVKIEQYPRQEDAPLKVIFDLTEEIQKRVNDPSSSSQVWHILKDIARLERLSFYIEQKYQDDKVKEFVKELKERTKHL